MKECLTITRVITTLIGSKMTMSLDIDIDTNIAMSMPHSVFGRQVLLAIESQLLEKLREIAKSTDRDREEFESSG